VFERFFRVDRARSRELGGTGLGLSIVKHLAQAMAGSVSATSRPGQGSIFSVRLPKAADD
jgi:two-component system phosphate regulon sensor histidine kinase PhoR